MARRQLGAMLRHLRGLMGRPGDGTDSQLLGRFVARQEEDAFEALLTRYGPLVHGLCRRILGDEHDADDAFQATFLVLARKADSVRKHESIGSWLYGVAFRVACDARAKAARRRRHEQCASDMATGGPAPSDPASTDPAAAAAWGEIRGILDEELHQLPEKYRAPLVLCYLRGMTNEEAAQELGWPPGSISKQLGRARGLLQARLARRGVAVSAPLLATALAAHAATAAMPADLSASALKIAMLYGAGRSIDAASTAALAEGAIHAMRMTKLKTAAAALFLIVGLLGTAAGFGLQSHLLPPLAVGPQLAVDQPKAEHSPAGETANRAAAGPDPVERFREALQVPMRDPVNPEEIRFRKAILEKRAGELKRIDDLRRVLSLQEWRDEDREEVIAAVDGPVRKELVTRFEREARLVLDKGSTEMRLAMLTMIGDMGTRVRGNTQNVSLARELAPDLIALLRKEPAGAVLEAAAGALGKINPDSKAAQALGKLLASTHNSIRQAAARGLASLPEETLALVTSSGLNRVLVTREEAVEMALQAVVAVVPGLKDPDAIVRRFCLETVQRAAALLAALVPDVPRLDFPPPGRKPSPDEQADMVAYRQIVEKERDLLLPLARTLSAQVAAVARAVADADWQTSVTAAGALESLASAREKLLLKAASVPRIDGTDEKKLREDPLRDSLRGAIPVAAKALARPEVRVRLAAIYFLETLRGEGAAAIPALVQSTGDGDPFVRWGVARALGRMAPYGAAAAVPALARLLADDNRDVRITAAAALERFGPAARPAVPALTRAAASKDVATRIWALQALGVIGAEAQAALPTLVDALSAPQYEVRVAAARSLGRLGSAARTAADALRKALNDPEASVREAAAAALLAIK